MTADTSRGRDPAGDGRVGWKDSLTEAWPLLITGVICVVLAAVFALEQTHRTADRLSPSFLFLAVGITGIVGGIASFAAGPDDEEENRLQPVKSVHAPPSAGPRADPLDTPERWNGRPVPDVVVSRPAAPPTAARRLGSVPAISPSSGPPGRPVRGPSPSPKGPQWTQGRLLRLSDEGELTIYSVDDALRDLELVTRIIHARRTSSSLDARRRPGTDPQ